MAKKVNHKKMGRDAISQKYEFIKDYNKLSISKLCKITEISRGAYYKWLNRKTNNRHTENTAIKVLILECFDKFKGIYGKLRIKKWLEKTYDIKINHKRVYRLMKELGLKSVIRKKRYKLKYEAPEIVKKNLLARDFNATKPNEKWSIDISYIKISEKTFKYLCAIKDLFNNEIVGYSISNSQTLLQVLETIEEATKGKDVKNLIIHSDQGFQFTNKQYINFLESKNIRVSHSRRGNCIDNSPIECFFGHLKSEYPHLYSPKTTEEIEESIKKYIKFYNEERIQLKLKGYSPKEYRTIA
ncbi:MAG: IS3 family transposase [Fusobacteriaceae bacterium]|nr:IS3 family transposase [Fusobacteriaceae bacterium]